MFVPSLNQLFVGGGDFVPAWAWVRNEQWAHTKYSERRSEKEDLPAEVVVGNRTYVSALDETRTQHRFSVECKRSMFATHAGGILFMFPNAHVEATIRVVDVVIGTTPAEGYP